MVHSTDRGDTTLLLKVVTQDFQIGDYDSSHFYQDPDFKELTVAEISKELGYKVKVIE